MCNVPAGVLSEWTYDLSIISSDNSQLVLQLENMTQLLDSLSPLSNSPLSSLLLPSLFLTLPPPSPPPLPIALSFFLSFYPFLPPLSLTLSLPPFLSLLSSLFIPPSLPRSLHYLIKGPAVSIEEHFQTPL